ncbi:hypothetical protein [Ruegeria sp.]|uniref:hypothetical protein n=1 Tax=Ruegeria sp. TaxID=1879320 RepID=UPI003C7B5F27
MKKVIVAALGCAFIAACAETSSQNGGAAENQSRAASKEKVFECAKAAGIKSQLAVETTISGGQIKERVLPKNGVTQAQADAANSCIAG